MSSMANAEVEKRIVRYVPIGFAVVFLSGFGMAAAAAFAPEYLWHAAGVTGVLFVLYALYSAYLWNKL